MNRKTLVSLMFILILFFILVGALTVPQGISFDQVNLEKIFYIVNPLFLIALFIERALEVFISAWRGKGEEELLAKVTGIITQAGGGKAAGTGEAKNQTGTSSINLVQAQSDLQLYKADTKKRALASGLAVGVLVSALGVRSLEPLFYPDGLFNLGALHRSLFSAIDIFITGALLGGGADGIHKLVNMIISFFDVTRKKIVQAPS